MTFWLFATGSSPLTRGKPDPIDGAGHVRRLIPAHAGKTARDAPPRRGLWAHPRSRGENLLFDNVGKELPGSSPLTRGKRFAFSKAVPIVRLIPAHAGKTHSTAATPTG